VDVGEAQSGRGVAPGDPERTGSPASLPGDGEMVEDSSLKNLFAFLVEQEKKHQQLLEDEYGKYFTPDY
jgi:hypothetical protein